MLAWWLLLIVLGLNGVGLIGSLWFIYHYCHSDDLKYNQGVFAQVVAILGFQIFYLAFTLVCYDSYNVAFSGGFNMAYFWKLIFLGLVMYLTLVVPLAVFYYQADSDPTVARRSPFIQTGRNAGACIIASWGLIGILYVTNRNVSVPQDSCAGETNCAFHTVSVDFLVFLIGLPAYFGWFVLMIVGGFGTAAVPIGLFYAWRYRPTPLSANDYEDARKVLGERATTLRTVGEALKRKALENSESSKGFRMRAPTHGLKLRQRVAKYKEVVNLLSDEYQRLEERRAGQIRSPLKTMGLFFSFVLSAICSTLILVQEIVTVLYPQIAKTKPIQGVGALMQVAQRGHLLLPEFIIYLAIYGHEVLCAVYGLIHLNAKLKGCLPVEPLRPQSTHLNAILFHVAVMILTGCAVIWNSIRTLPGFVKGTEAEKIALIHQEYMKMHKWAFDKAIFEWIWLIVLILSAIWLIISPATQPPINLNDPKVMARWAKLNNKLGVDGPSNNLEPIPETPADNSPPEKASRLDRMRNKLNRFDQGVAEAPTKLMGAALKKPWQ